jgi:hypothetical protein
MGGRRRASRASEWTDGATRVLVTGDADWRDEAVITAILRRLVARYGTVRIAHADDEGAAVLAARAARRLGLAVDSFTAEWTLGDGTRDAGAGMRRNRLMCRTFQADLVVAFSANLAAAEGAADIVRTAFAGGSQVYLVDVAGQVRRWSGNATRVGRR